MVVNVVQVRTLAQAFLDSLKNLTASELEKVPTAAFGENFNNVVSLARTIAKHVDESLWPKPIESYTAMTGQMANTRYAELETYARQVLGLLPQVT